jgi:hypothetical protein
MLKGGDYYDFLIRSPKGIELSSIIEVHGLLKGGDDND